jgi:hypothetical protein
MALFSWLPSADSQRRALTLYSDIKGELTAKNTDAGIFDAILRIY